MAEPYLTDLRSMVDEWTSTDPQVGQLDCRHFFAGAAAYREGSIVASLTPVGLAFKVPSSIRDELIETGEAVPLRYFPNAPVKKNYILFEDVARVTAHEATRLLVADPFD